MTGRCIATVCLAAALGVTGQAANAGLTIEYTNKNPGDKEAQASTLRLESDRFRIDGGPNSVIYRADKQIVWVIEVAKKRYVEMTKESMDQMANQMSGAVAQMQEQMKGMSPEEQAMVQKMMQGKMGMATSSAPAAPRTYVKNGKSDTVNGFACAGYDVMRSGKREQALCVADWAALDITLADFKALEDYAEMMSKMMGPFASRMEVGFAQKFRELPGPPVRAVTFREKGESVQELKRVTRGSIAASEFEVPAGLEKQTMESMSKSPR
jgi:hypothetical protein